MTSKKYKFSTKNSKEAISTTDAFTKEAAIAHFAKVKNLTISAFLKIYDVTSV